MTLSPPPRGAVAACLAALVLVTAPASAQPKGKAGKATQAVVPITQEDQDAINRQAEAKKLFEKGLALFEKDQWDAALAEFVRSRKAWPTRAATKYAASCLRELRRLDEALEMFEEVLAFPNLSDKDRKFAADAVAALEKRVGTLVLKGGEPGASVIIDGRYRGALPLPGPLRIVAGSHEIGAFKEGQDPFGATAEISGKKESVVELRNLSTGGRLKIAEQRGRQLDVLVDGVVVGKTPWEGPLSVGDHLITLRGDVNLDAECAPTDDASSAAKRAAPRGNIEVGTQPVSVPIKLHELTKLSLTAEELDTTLRIEPTPGGASVAIDSVLVGRGAWEGRLRVGEHKVEVISDGFFPDARKVNLLRGKRLVLKVDLDRDRNTPEWRAARNGWAGAAFGVGGLGLAVFGVTGGLAVAKTNDLRGACSGGVCPPSAQQGLGAARTLGTVSTVGLVVGGAGAVAGGVILLAARPGGAPKRAGSSSPSLRAALGPGSFTVQGEF